MRLKAILAVVAAIGLIAGGVYVRSARASHASPGAVGSGAAAPLPKVTPELFTQWYDQLEAADGTLPKEDFDVQALADKVGSEPQKAFEWVRDNTVWVPYRGVLRGALGVLLDRRGNSLDRSLLLAQLITAGGATVRLAHATLTPEKAQETWPALVAPRRPPVLPAGRSQAPRLNGGNPAIEKTTAELRAQVDAQTSDISAALKQIGVGGDATSSDAALAALRDHYWVQYQDNNSWVDLDPLLPGTPPQRALVAADDTLEPDSLDAALSHQVTLHVVVEQWTNGALKEHELLSSSIAASEALTKTITLFHCAPDWPDGVDVLTKSDVAKMKPAVLAQARWVPVLVVDGKNVVKNGFAVDGEPFELTSDDSGGSTDVGGLFGGLGGGGDTAKTAKIPKARKSLSDGVATAEWLDFEVAIPGQTSTTIRREIFDLLGPAARKSAQPAKPRPSDDQRLDVGLKLLGHVDTLIQGAELPATYGVHDVIQRELSQRDAWLGAAAEQDPARRRELVHDIDEATVQGSGALGTYALARQLLNPQRADVFVDEPNIVTYRAYRRLEEGQPPSLLELMDVVTNGRGVRPGAARPFDVRLSQGVVDTAAEILALSTDLAHAKNTIEVFANAKTRGTGLVVASKSRAGALNDLHLSQDVSTRVNETLTSNLIAILPKAAQMVDGAPRFGWWRVNPATGESLGVMDSGFNQAGTERTVITSRASLVTRALSPAFVNTSYVAGATEAQLAADLGVEMTDELFWALVRLRTVAMEAMANGLAL